MEEKLTKDPIDSICELADQQKLSKKYILKLKNDLNIALKSYKAECLLYLFPLIERLVVEIMTYIPGFDIEKYEQGTYRTMASILGANKNLLIEMIGKEDYELLKCYYVDSDGKTALRNLICHVSDIKIVEIRDIQNIKNLSINLLLLLEGIFSRKSEIIKNKIDLLV